MPEYPSRQRLSSIPDIGAAAEGEEIAEAALRMEKAKDTSYLSLEIHEDAVATSDVLLQSPSPQPIVDVVIAGRLRSSFDAERTGEHTPHPPQGQYDIV